MSAASFEPVALSLEAALTEWFAGRSVGTRRSARGTIATNSTLVEERGRPLVELLAARGVALPGRRVVDIGCGFGALSAYLAWHGAEVVGVDRDNRLFRVGRRVARRHGLALTLRRGLMQRLDVGESAFDVALMNNTLCYLVDEHDRRAALATARRALRPGGILLVREPNGRHPIDQFTSLPLLPMLSPARAAALAERLGRRRPPVRLVDTRRLRRDVAAAGFDAVRTEVPAGGVPRRLLAPVARYQHVTARR